MLPVLLIKNKFQLKMTQFQINSFMIHTGSDKFWFQLNIKEVRDLFTNSTLYLLLKMGFIPVVVSSQYLTGNTSETQFVIQRKYVYFINLKHQKTKVVDFKIPYHNQRCVYQSWVQQIIIIVSINISIQLYWLHIYVHRVQMLCGLPKNFMFMGM